MAIIQASGLNFDVDVVVFDKDGTLIDFHVMWGQRATAAVKAVLGVLGDDDRLEGALYRTLGYDPVSGATNGDGPLATVPLYKIDVAMSTVLYQHGLPWEKAERAIRANFSPVMSSEPTEEFVQPLGDVRGAVRRLRAAGLHTVVATTDNRGITLKLLEMLGILGCFELIYCGDDEEQPTKPSPNVMLDIARRCAVDPGRLMMVGDTVSDLSMAQAAGAGARIGVVGGSTARSVLAEWSDALVSSIDELSVAQA